MPTFTNLIAAIVTGSANVSDANFRTWGGELEDYAVGFEVADKSTGYTVVAADRGKLIRCTASLTLTLTAAATIGAEYMVAVKADGGDVTIDPNASEQINGASTLTLSDGSWALLYCTGTAWRALVVGTAGIADLIDEDDLATDSATRPPSQQSVKAYVDQRTGRAYAESASASTVTATVAIDNTKPQSSEGTEVISTTYTPQNAGSRLRCRAVIPFITGSAAIACVASMYNGAADPIQMAYQVLGLAEGSPMVIEAEYAPGTTSTQTISVRVGVSSGTAYINQRTGATYGGASKITLTIEEIMP